VLILISCVVLSVDSPLLDPASTIARTLSIFDAVLTYTFLAEMIIKVLALGFVFGSSAYLTSAWNWLDAVLVAISLYALSGSASQNISGLRSLRALRALRPLRVINRNAGLKVVVNSLFRAIPSILNVLVILVLFLFIFATVSVSFFKGSFSQCDGPVFEALTEDQQNLVVYPRPFNELSAEEQMWAADPAGAPTYPSSNPTSRDVCMWLGGSWDPVVT